MTPAHPRTAPQEPRCEAITPSDGNQVDPTPRRPSTGRKRGPTEAAALAVCAKVGGAYRDLARERVRTLLGSANPETRVDLALAGALGVSERQARRIIRAVDDDTAPRVKLTPEERLEARRAACRTFRARARRAA